MNPLKAETTLPIHVVYYVTKLFRSLQAALHYYCKATKNILHKNKFERGILQIFSFFVQ